MSTTAVIVQARRASSRLPDKVLCKLAGETVVEARAKNDFSKASLSAYETRLKNSVALKDVEKYRDLPKIMTSTPEMFSLYPKKLNQLMVDYFTVKAEPKADIQKAARKKFFSGVSKIKLLKDVFKARKMM